MKRTRGVLAGILLIAIVTTQLQGCAAVAVGAVTTAASVVVKAPIKVGGALVDLATESEEEKKKKEEKAEKRGQ